MKFWKTISIAVFVTNTTAFAGDSGHGAGALECGETIRFLDLLEAEQEGLIIPIDDQTPVDQQAKKAIDKLCPVNPGFCQRVQYFYEQSQKIRNQPPKGMRLSPPSDAVLKHIPENCHFVGIGKWHDSTSGADDYLQIQESDLEKMSKTDQAAFWVHEPIYKAYREMIHNGYQALRRSPSLPSDSRASRFMVGRLFSTQELPALMAHAQGEFVAKCKSFFGDDVFLTSDGISKIGVHVARTPFRWSFGAKPLVIEDEKFVRILTGKYDLKSKEKFSVSFPIPRDLLSETFYANKVEDYYALLYAESIYYQKQAINHRRVISETVFGGGWFSAQCTGLSFK